MFNFSQYLHIFFIIYVVSFFINCRFFYEFLVTDFALCQGHSTPIVNDLLKTFCMLLLQELNKNVCIFPNFFVFKKNLKQNVCNRFDSVYFMCRFALSTSSSGWTQWHMDIYTCTIKCMSIIYMHCRRLLCMGTKKKKL